MSHPIIEVEPYNQERFRKRGRVKLYYVGTKFHTDHQGDPPPVNVKTMPIPFPQLGEYLEIDEVYARDLTQKSRYQGKPVYLAEKDGGADVAKLIKQALKAGTKLEDFDLTKFKVKREIEEMSDEDFLQAVKSRKGKIDPAILAELLNEVPMAAVAKPAEPQIEVPLYEEEEVVEESQQSKSKVTFKPKAMKG